MKKANQIRNAVLLLGWFVIMVGGIYFNTAPPPPIKVKAPTEASIKGDLKREQDERKIKRFTAAARSVYRANGCRDTFSDLTGRTAYEFGLSPRLLAAIVFVESSCKASAVSGRNSVGLMQVNSKVWGHYEELKDPVQNMRLGAKILKSYTSRYGVVEGLHRYNGLGNKTNSYAERVLEVANVG